MLTVGTAGTGVATGAGGATTVAPGMVVEDPAAVVPLGVRGWTEAVTAGADGAALVCCCGPAGEPLSLEVPAGADVPLAEGCAPSRFVGPEAAVAVPVWPVAGMDDETGSGDAAGGPGFATAAGRPWTLPAPKMMELGTRGTAASE